MNGPHDFGGTMGHGPIAPEADEPVFHAEWERRAFAVSLAMGRVGGWNIDVSRHARERIPPKKYLASSYYEIWIEGLTTLLREWNPSPKPLTADMVGPVLKKGGPADRPSSALPSFKAGDKIRTRNIHVEGHTRLPRYARGRVGEIVMLHGTHVFPDSSAHAKGDDPRWLYAVRFTAKELWGREENGSVTLDLWEPYLEPA
jgi:nitrile hydratase subunit beta